MNEEFMFNNVFSKDIGDLKFWEMQKYVNF